MGKSFKSTLTLVLGFYFSNLDLETTTWVRQHPDPPSPYGPHRSPLPPTQAGSWSSLVGNIS